MTDAELQAAYAALLCLPRAEQPEAALRLRDRIPAHPGEAWNTAFGVGSLFEAFSATRLAGAVYAHNRALLAPVLGRPGFRVLEVGGGNGAVFSGAVPEDARGEIVVVDPHPDGAVGVRAAVPPGVEVRHLAGGIESTPLPAVDVAVVSLTLHHVAGRSAGERAEHGLTGPGKGEALLAIREALRERGGRLLLNEADVGCEVTVASATPLLRERLVDSYVRRFGAAVLADLRDRPDAARWAPRWRGIVRDWALGQVAAAEVPVAQRDVYELTVPEWGALLAESGLVVERVTPTDPWMLFWAWVARVGA